LAQRAERQRRAAGTCACSRPNRVKQIPDIHIAPTLNILVKDGDVAKMHDALREVAMTIDLDVQPYGVRLFRDANARLDYDVDKQAFNILLKNAPCTKPYRFALPKKDTKVVVKALDMIYIHALQAETGQTAQCAAFDMDYVLKIEPSAELKSWKQPVIKLNGKTNSWEKLSQGIAYDYLPKTMTLRVEGDDGNPRACQFTLDAAALESAALSDESSQD